MHTLQSELEFLACDVLPAKVIRGLQRHGASVFRESLYQSRRQLFGQESSPARFVIRVDDFPRWDLPFESFIRFHDIMSKHDVSYVLGVTPFLCYDGQLSRDLTDAELDCLRLLASTGVELALHGFTHEFRLAPDGKPSETFFYDDTKLELLLDRAITWFRENHLPRPRHYVPPFNAFSERDFHIIIKRLPVFHGGPWSLTTFGKFAPGSVLGGLARYWPSYEPFYARAHKLLSFLRRQPSLPAIGRQVLTLHWAWEHESDHRFVGPLLRWLSERDLLDDAEVL